MKEEITIRVSRHNGRSKDNTAKHNDRDFNIDHSNHIDAERTAANIYWDCYQGTRIAGADPGRQLNNELNNELNRKKPVAVFEEIEMLYYDEHYAGYCEGQNGRNNKARHSERNKSTFDLLEGTRTQPEETILQIGNIEATVDASILLQAMEWYQKWFEESYGEHVHIIDWALHMDEATLHIHERHVFDYTNRYGELQPMQEKALEALGIERPDPDQPKSRTNNRKATFDHICRAKWMNICMQLGIDVDRGPITGRKHMQKDDYIIANQDRRIADQAAKLDRLEVEISDIDGMIRDITDEVYDKVVEEVCAAAADVATEAVIKEADHYNKELMESGEDIYLRYPRLIRRIIDGLKHSIRRMRSGLATAIRSRLRNKDTQAAIKMSAGTHARESILESLHRYSTRRKEAASEQRESDRTGHSALR